MNKSKTGLLSKIIVGILLVLAGVTILLNNFGIIRDVPWTALMGPLIGVGGLVFLLVFIFDPKEWWALIPAFVLIAVGISVFMGQNFESLYQIISGAIFLGLLGLAFILIYLTHHQHWWAIIPGGVLLTLAGVSLISNNSALEGTVFFLGLAVTFGLVYILPKPSGKLTWALYPAGILLLIGILVSLNVTDVMGFIIPIALLVVGAYLVIKAIKKNE